MASTEGGVEIEEVAARTPGEDHQGRDRPGDRLPAVPRPPDRLRRSASRASRSARRSASCARVYRAFTELDASLVEINPLVVTAAGELVALDAKMNFDGNALYRQPRVRRAARPRRGGPARDRGQPARAQLHQARRQHRLHGQRRRAGDGDHGHHQAVRRRAGQLPRRRRRRHQGAGDRGVQDPALGPQGRGRAGQHLRRHHALRRDRRGRRRGGARGQSRRAAGGPAGGHQRRPRQADPRANRALRSPPRATSPMPPTRSWPPSERPPDVGPGRSRHQGHLPGLHRQPGHLPLRAGDRLRHPDGRRRDAGQGRRQRTSACRCSTPSPRRSPRPAPTPR